MLCDTLFFLFFSCFNFSLFFPMVLKKGEGVQTFVTFYTLYEFVSFHALVKAFGH